MIICEDVLSLKTPWGATMVSPDWGNFMGVQITGKCICNNCAL